MHDRVVAGFRHRLLELYSAWPEAERRAEAERVIARVRERSGEGSLLARALLEEYEATRSRVRPPVAPAETPRFLADASLGGLARWLRAAGYEARVAGDGPGGALEEALRLGLVLLTTDTALLDRRVVAAGRARVVWLPSLVGVREQLRLVIGDLGLRLREPRCMACGGALAAREKASVHARIPPRTARWKDEYFVCEWCDRLFWQGSHWERILGVLREAAVSA